LSQQAWQAFRQKDAGILEAMRKKRGRKPFKSGESESNIESKENLGRILQRE